MREISLEVQLREGKGSKKGLSALRAGKQIPAIIYGGKKPPLSISVPEKDLMKAATQGGANALLRLKHPQGEDTVILKELSRHVVTQNPIHADFQRVSLQEKIEVRVPLRVVGEAPGVKLHGGILEHILRELEVRCQVGEIPQEIAVDVSALEIGHAIHVKELRIPAHIEPRVDPEQIVVNVVAPAAEEVAAPAAAEPGAAEPEVIAKGKKEEELEGAAPAKGAAPAVPPKSEKKEEKK